VQEADDDERGSATTTGEEEGGRRNASNPGKSGASSSQHSCDGPTPQSALTPSTPPGGGSLARSRRPSSGCEEGSSGSIRESRGAARRSRLRTITSQNQTEPLEIIPLYSNKEKEPDYYLFVTLLLILFVAT
jgi:hypothetical protein